MLSLDDSGNDSPRWTLPPRKKISPDNLHISSFVIVRKETRAEEELSILLLRSGEKHPLSFRRGKLLLPATILRYGENPREGARRALSEQLGDLKRLKDPEFFGMQSYLGTHWDLVFLFNTRLEDGGMFVQPREPFVEAAFHDVKKLMRNEIAEDHLEVIDEMLNLRDAV